MCQNTDLKRTAPPPPLPQGRRQVFKGGGLDPRYDKRGGGGGEVLSASGPIRKAGGGGGVLSALGPIRKAGGGGGGAWVCAVHFRHNTKGGRVA